MGESTEAAPEAERVRRLLIALAAILVVAPPMATAADPTINARVDPAAPRFGDTFAYVVSATVGTPDLAGARVVVDVAPFTRLGPPVDRRTSASGVGHITVAESLACLSAACLGRPVGAAVALPRARVFAGGKVAVAPRLEIAVGLRVSPAAVDAADPVFRRPETLPGTSFRFSPSAATAVLVVLGIALLAVGVAVLTGPLRLSRAAQRRTAVDVDQRDRAVRLLRESATRDAADRRRAASLASRIVSEPDLARTAAGVAWSRPEPGPPDATTLADRVEQAPARGV